MDFQYLKYELRDGIAWVTIDRPEQRNALNRATLLELIDAFKRVDADEDVRVAILTGAGKVFVGGADLNELSVMSALDYLDYGNLYNVLNRLIREGGKPVIGAVNGHALGGGNVMILSCDIIVASERAKFAVPEINLGIFGGASVLPRLVGRYQAAEMVLLGEAYTAQKAYELGLVNRVVPRRRSYPPPSPSPRASGPSPLWLCVWPSGRSSWATSTNRALRPRCSCPSCPCSIPATTRRRA